MNSWTEEFGKFVTHAPSWESKKKIYIYIDDNTTGEEMVVMAIRLAKRYNCKIVGRVEYHPATVGGTVSFMVQCHSLTYRYFYEDGRTLHLHNSEVTEKDLQKYEEQFGTRTCIDKNFKKQFWFTDNWYGSVLYFPTLRKAKEAAKHQIGVSCCIHETFPYGRASKIVCFAPASGHIPP